MPFNGAGVFTQVYNWVTDKANAVLVTASRFQATYDDMATALTNCMTRDGQSPPSANIPMGSHRITDMAAGIASTDAVNVGQVPLLLSAETFFDAGNTGVALAIDFITNGRNQQFTLTNNAMITLGNGGTPGWYTLKPLQDATGARSITWAGAGYSAGRWSGSQAAPVLNIYPSSADLVRLFWDGSVWYMVRTGPVGVTALSGTNAYSTSQTALTASAAYVKVALQTKTVDPLGEFDAITNYRFIVKNAGYYAVSFYVEKQQTAAGTTFVTAALYKSGVAVPGFTTGNAFNDGVSKGAAGICAVGFSGCLILAAAEYLELFVYDNKAGGVSGALSIYKIG